MEFIGSPRQWIPIKRTWENVLAKFHIREFHAKDFFARDRQGKRTGHYRDWSEDKAHDFLEKLLSAATQQRVRAIGGSVDVTAFNSFTHGERRFLTGGNIKDIGK